MVRLKDIVSKEDGDSSSSSSSKDTTTTIDDIVFPDAFCSRQNLAMSS